MKILRIIIPSLLIFLSCEKEDSFSDQFDFMYGTWHTVQVSFGIGGSSINDFCEILRLNHPNEYSLLIENTIVDHGIINIGIKGDQKLNLVFKSESTSDNLPLVSGFHNFDIEVLILHEDSIRMDNHVSDFGYFSASFVKE